MNILQPVSELQIAEGSRRSVFTQTTTYSGAAFDERSFKIEVPAHRGSSGTYDQLTVVMHAATRGVWQGPKVKWIYEVVS